MVDVPCAYMDAIRACEEANRSLEELRCFALVAHEGVAIRRDEELQGICFRIGETSGVILRSAQGFPAAGE